MVLALTFLGKKELKIFGVLHSQSAQPTDHDGIFRKSMESHSAAASGRKQ